MPKILLTIFLSLLFVGGAIAQSVPVSNTSDPNTANFSVNATDISLGLLQQIIGDLTNPTPDPSGIGDIFRAVNLGILVCAALLFMYFAIVGTLKSAEDGVVLGKKWGSWTVPLRLVLGLSMLFPLANGFCGAQVACYELASAGIGFANWTASFGTSRLSNGQGMIVASKLISDTAAKDMMIGILKAEACVADHNFNATDPGSATYSTAYGGPFVTQGSGNNSYSRVTWGITPGAVRSGDPRYLADTPDMCGSIELPNFNAVAGAGNGEGVASNFLSDTVAEGSRIVKGANLQAANLALRQAHFNAITQSANTLRPYGQYFAYPNSAVSPNDLAPQINAAASAYRNSVSTAMSSPSVLPDTKVMAQIITDGVNKNGWSALGSWYYQFARVDNELSKMTGYSPKFTQALGGALDSSLSTRIESTVTISAHNPATATQISSAGHTEGGVAGNLINMNNTVGNATTKFIGTSFGVDPSNPENALIQLKDSGDNILTAAEAVWIGSVAVKLMPGGALDEGFSSVFNYASKVMGGVGGEIIKNLMIFCLVSILCFAMTLSFWLPMAPFIIWIGAVLGWVISVLEMIVAAPLWACAHMHPDGDDMTGKGGAGYMIALEVFLKPVLLVLGFFLSSKLLDPFLRFFSSMFFNNVATINGSNVNSINTVLSVISFTVIYVAVCVSLTHKCFSLVHVIPTHALRWVGGAADRFSHGQDFGREMQSGAQKSAGSMSQNAERAVRTKLQKSKGVDDSIDGMGPG